MSMSAITILMAFMNKNKRFIHESENSFYAELVYKKI
jgi:hypothetical protein